MQTPSKLILFLALFSICLGAIATQVNIDKTVNADAYTKEIAQFYAINNADHLKIERVEGYQQTTDYTCGQAAVMSLLHFYGKLSDSQMNHETEMRIAKEMGNHTPKATSLKQITTWLKHNNFKVIAAGEHGTIEMLQHYIKNGIPVIVEWVDWGGHWVVATGYDTEGKSYTDEKDLLFLADPAVQYDNIRYTHGLNVMNPDRFRSMWFDAQYFNPGHLTKGIYIVAVPK